MNDMLEIYAANETFDSDLALYEAYIFSRTNARWRGRGRAERVNLNDFTPDEWRCYFRFTRDEVHQLVLALQLPERIIADNNIVEPAEEALVMLLAKLAWPLRLQNYHHQFS